MLYIFTGNGKGKTTAALGQAVRAVGEGKKVLMIQFIKGPWKSGEDFFAESRIKNQELKIIKVGKGFVGVLGDKLPFEEHRKAAEEGLGIAKKEIESGEWDIVILDEINNAISLGLLSLEKVLDFMQASSGKTQDLIFTGRDAPPQLIQEADLVSEIQEIKHPFTEGKKAKRGIEY